MPPKSRVPRSQHVRPGAKVNIVLKADQPTGRLTIGTVADVLTRGDHPRGIKVRLTGGHVGRVQSFAADAPPPATGGSQLGSCSNVFSPPTDDGMDHRDEAIADTMASTTIGTDREQQQEALPRGGHEHENRRRREDGISSSGRSYGAAGSGDGNSGREGNEMESLGVRQTCGLDAFVKPARGQKKRKKKKLEAGGHEKQQEPEDEEGEETAEEDHKKAAGGWPGRSVGVPVAVAGGSSPLAGQVSCNVTEAGSEAAAAETAEPSAETETTAMCPVCHGFEGDETAVAHHVASHFD